MKPVDLKIRRADLGDLDVFLSIVRAACEPYVTAYGKIWGLIGVGGYVMKKLIPILVLAALVGGCASAPLTKAPVASKSPVTHHFSWVDMLSPESGWALGSDRETVYRTSNGVTWTASGEPRHIAHSPYGSILYTLSSREAWYAFTVNGTTIGLYHTVDGARHWTYQTVLFAYIPGLEGSDQLGGPVAISFANKEYGWLMVAPQHGMSTEPGVLYRTENGGTTWQVVSSTYSNSGNPSLPFNGELSFAGSQDGWLVGSMATTSPKLLYKTADGGVHWSKVLIPIAKGMPGDKASVIAPPVFSAKHGAMAVRFRGTGSSVIYESADGGETWQFAYAQSAAHGSADQVVDIVTAAPKVLAFTYDTEFSNIGYVQGNDWTASAWTESGRIPKRLLQDGGQVSELDFVNPSDGWVIITHTTNLPVVLRTTDSGNSWSKI